MEARCPDILGEVEVVAGERTTQVVLFVAAQGDEIFEVRGDALIGTLASRIWTHPVMDLWTTIQAQDHIFEMLVDELGFFFIQQNTIGRHGQAQNFAALLAPLLTVIDQFNHDRPVQERFTAKKSMSRLRRGPEASIRNQLPCARFRHRAWCDAQCQNHPCWQSNIRSAGCSHGRYADTSI